MGDGWVKQGAGQQSESTAAADGAEVQRFDRADLPKAERSAEGYLIAPATRVARIGPLVYTRADGSQQIELRLPEDLAEPASLATMHMQPVTLDHPREGFVNALNFRQRAVGVVANPAFDGESALADVHVMDGQAVADVLAGRAAEVSLGYRTRLEALPNGVFEQPGHPLDGTRADFVQRGVRYNHLALVARGRANEGTEDRPVRIRLDAAGNQLPAEAGSTHQAEAEHGRADQEHPMKTVKMKIGDAEYDVPEAVASYIESLKSSMSSKPKADEDDEPSDPAAAMKMMIADMAALKARVAEMEAKADGYKKDAEMASAKMEEEKARADSAEGRLAGLEAKIAEAEALRNDASQVEARANTEAARIALIQRLVTETKRPVAELCRLDDAGLRIEAVKARCPNLDLTGKSPDFVAGVLARLDAEAPVAMRGDSATQIASALYTAPAPGPSGSDESPLVKAHRERAARAQESTK